ncbi:MAG: Dyp-type peroxidase [Geminicoccaceae bacterium]
MTKPDPSIDYADIQGLVRFAHGRLTEAVFLLLNVRDAARACAWLAELPVTDAERKAPPPDTAVQIAFSADGLRALGLDDALIEQFSHEFLYGMAGEDSRSRRLGDVAHNAPERWHWGQTPPHVLLMLYAHRDIDAHRVAICDAGFDAAFNVGHVLPTKDIGPIEPFGFIDGISQPAIDWAQAFSTDRHERDAYANHLALGEVLLGYSNEYGEYAPRPMLEPQSPGADDLAPAEDQPALRDFGRNGSYLVFRQLHQDVRAFWQHLDHAANGDSDERERLGAAMVGRQRDGTPLMPEGDAEIPGGRRGNLFLYDSDLDGRRCPVGAHIRRANPRTGDYPPGVRGFWTRFWARLGFRGREDGKQGRHDLVASSRFHRLLRRGREYGDHLPIDEALKPGPDAERGLHFICLCANLVRQFEFVQDAWINASTFDGVQGEGDPLLGSRAPLINGSATDRFTIPDATGVARRLEGLPAFVTLRGGGYFFMPSLRALRFIARKPG